ncbi:MAG: hypothetical protein E3J78_03315, partial [Candidatus Cloacimonadota bacterium]
MANPLLLLMCRILFRSKKGEGQMDLTQLNERQLDSIKEISNIGSGHAATALSQLTKKKVMVSVPEVKVLKVEQLPSLFPEAEEIVVGIL